MVELYPCAASLDDRHVLELHPVPPKDQHMLELYLCAASLKD